MTHLTENLRFVGVYHQSSSTYLSFEIQSHLAKIRDSVREQTDVISVVEVFEKK